MRTILYLVNIGGGALVGTFEGEDDTIPQEAQDEAQRCADTTGMTHVLARGALFFQAEVKQPVGDAERPEAKEPAEEDLRAAENRALLSTLLQVLIKVGVVDEGSAQAPWDTAIMLRLVGLWLSDSLPWAKAQSIPVAFKRLEQAMADIYARVEGVEKNLGGLEAAKDEAGTTVHDLERRVERDVLKGVVDRLEERQDELGHWADEGILDTHWYQAIRHRLTGLEEGLGTRGKNRDATQVARAGQLSLLSRRTDRLEEEADAKVFACGNCGSCKVRRTSPDRVGEVRCRDCHEVGPGEKVPL